MVLFLFAATALALVIVGVLIMTQVLSLEQLGAAVWRVLVFLWTMIVVCFLLRWVLLPILICVLVLLKTAMLLALVIVIAAILLLVVLRVALLKGVNGAKEQETKEE